MTKKQIAINKNGGKFDSTHEAISGQKVISGTNTDGYLEIIPLEKVENFHNEFNDIIYYEKLNGFQLKSGKFFGVLMRLIFTIKKMIHYIALFSIKTGLYMNVNIN